MHLSIQILYIVPDNYCVYNIHLSKHLYYQRILYVYCLMYHVHCTYTNSVDACMKYK